MKLITQIVLVYLLMTALCHFCNAQVIPPERQVDWSVALNSYNYRLPLKEVNVKDFGAIGDGVNDDQTAIAEAISSLNGELGYVYFPAGTYLLKNPISLPDSVILRGDGANVCELRFNFNQLKKIV